MKILFVLLIAISNTWSLITISDCLFAKPTVLLDFIVMESGFFGRRVIDGYVTNVLTRLPTEEEYNMRNFNTEGLIWSKSDDDKPSTLILVIEKGLSNYSGMRHQRCTVTKPFNTVFIAITNFNSSNPLCVNELEAIQNEQRRIFASSCFGSKSYLDTRYFRFKNNQINQPFFVTYTQPEEIFADFHNAMIKKLRDDNESSVPHPNSGKLKQCLDPSWSKCPGWRDGSITFEAMANNVWADLIFCPKPIDKNRCQGLSGPWEGYHFPPHFPGTNTDFDIGDCCKLIPSTD